MTMMLINNMYRENASSAGLIISNTLMLVHHSAFLQ